MRFQRLHDALALIEGDIDQAHTLILDAAARGNRIWIVGNGGSAAIASHIAVDFTKNANLPAQAFNDASLLTCFANDYGYEQVFAKAVDFKAAAWDCLIAISSSGESRNILNAVMTARNRDLRVVTLSGFAPTNKLRALGDVNLYVPARDYGTVEIAHLAILHSMVPA